MRKLLIFLLIPLLGCASMKHHPVLYGIAAGAVAGGTVAILTHHSCPHMINGYPYDGTPPCPNPKTYDPGWTKR